MLISITMNFTNDYHPDEDIGPGAAELSRWAARPHTN